MQHTDAVDVIETLGSEGQLEHVSLEDCHVAVGKILGCHLRSEAQVDTDHACAPASRHFRETAHSTTNIEDQLAREVFRLETRTLTKRAFRTLAGGIVELRL